MTFDKTINHNEVIICRYLQCVNSKAKYMNSKRETETEIEREKTRHASCKRNNAIFFAAILISALRIDAYKEEKIIRCY